MFGSAAEIDIKLSDEDSRKWVDVKNEEGTVDRQSLYYDGETVAGNVMVNIKAGKKVEHQGIRIEFVGQIGEALSCRKNGPSCKYLRRAGISSHSSALATSFGPTD